MYAPPELSYTCTVCRYESDDDHEERGDRERDREHDVRRADRGARRARRAPPRSRMRPTRAGRTRRSGARATSGAASPRAGRTPSGGRRRPASAAACGARASGVVIVAVEDCAGCVSPRRAAGRRRLGRRAAPRRRSAGARRAGCLAPTRASTRRKDGRRARAAAAGTPAPPRARAGGCGQQPLVGCVHDVRERACEVDAVVVARRARRHARRGAAAGAAWRRARRRRAAVRRGAPASPPTAHRRKQLRGHASTVGRPSQSRLRIDGGVLKKLSSGGRHEPVAGAGLGQQVARPRGIGLELPAQLRDVDVEIVRLRAVRRPPHLAQDRAVGEELALVDARAGAGS